LRVYTVYIMSRPKVDSAVLTIRVPATLDRRLAREARRLHKTRSQVARAILEAGLSPGGPDAAAEARRQSLLVSRRRSDQETLRFIVDAADLRGWRD
jgi:antidote-toxin recognition MazE-like antitoxin